MANRVGEVITQALQYGGISSPETDAIIAAVNEPKADQTEERDALIELRALDALIRDSAQGNSSIAGLANAHRIGVCLRRQEISPALKCR